ncbi:hypothetical protein [Medusavirus stheno T3]|uniref:Uncharacterized protein n=1 Tax=Medusavirus stheno T3 TaxID=3069717 RepID=A0A7S7YES1_9VIRU|nr:hypothetical protein QKU73_gp312 [Acanthamoeba castellanii medusavirus]QPB44463.1 hypothetical protein [Medusavirus stheno T3]
MAHARPHNHCTHCYFDERCTDDECRFLHTGQTCTHGLARPAVCHAHELWTQSVRVLGQAHRDDMTRRDKECMANVVVEAFLGCYQHGNQAPSEEAPLTVDEAIALVSSDAQFMNLLAMAQGQIATTGVVPRAPPRLLRGIHYQ